MGQDFLDMQYYNLTFVFKQTYVEIETDRDRNQKKEKGRQKTEKWDSYTALHRDREPEKQRDRRELELYIKRLF